MSILKNILCYDKENAFDNRNKENVPVDHHPDMQAVDLSKCELLSCEELEELAELLKDADIRLQLQSDLYLVELLKCQLNANNQLDRDWAEQLARCLANFCAYNRDGAVQIMHANVVKWESNQLLKSIKCSRGDLFLLSLLWNLIVTFCDDDMSESDGQESDTVDHADIDAEFNFIEHVKESASLEPMIEALANTFRRYGNDDNVDVSVVVSAVETLCFILEYVAIESAVDSKLLIDYGILKYAIKFLLRHDVDMYSCVADCERLVRCIFSVCHAEASLNILSNESFLFQSMIKQMKTTDDQIKKSNMASLIFLVSNAPVPKWPLGIKEQRHICESLLDDAVKCTITKESCYFMMASSAQFLIGDDIIIHFVSNEQFLANIFSGILPDFIASDDIQKQHVALTIFRNISVTKSLRSVVGELLVQNGTMNLILDIFTSPEDSLDEGKIVLGQTPQQVIKSQCLTILRNLFGSLTETGRNQILKSHNLLAYTVKTSNESEIESVKSECCRLLCQMIKHTSSYENDIDQILKLIFSEMIGSRHNVLKMEALDALTVVAMQKENILTQAYRERLIEYSETMASSTRDYALFLISFKLLRVLNPEAVVGAAIMENLKRIRHTLADHDNDCVLAALDSI